MALKFEAFTQSDAFLERTRSFLLRHEVEARVILEGTERATTEEGWWFFSVILDAEPVLAAALESPYNVIVSPGSANAVSALVDGIRAMQVPVPGVSGAGAIARRFADLWTASTGGSVTSGVKLTIHRLTKVVWPPLLPSGHFRAGTAADVPTLNGWMEELTSEFGARVRGFAEDRFARGQLFIWDDDGPAAMACWQGETPSGVEIAGVYTPPSKRGRGYASACVASLSQRMLNEGWQFCYLFTDRSAPGPARIYRRIGYEPVGEVDNYIFRPKESRV